MEEEIWGAIDNLKNNSAPGSHGLPAEFYKAYADLLILRIAETYEEAFERGILPVRMREVIKITLLKTDKPPDKCASYCPLSLINVDSKILLKYWPIDYCN